MGNRYRASVERDILRREIALHVAPEDMVEAATAAGLVLDEGHSSYAVFRLEEEAAQALLDDLLGLGLKPTRDHGEEAAYLRKLVDRILPSALRHPDE